MQSELVSKFETWLLDHTRLALAEAQPKEVSLDYGFDSGNKLSVLETQ